MMAARRCSFATLVWGPMMLTFYMWVHECLHECLQVHVELFVMNQHSNAPMIYSFLSEILGACSSLSAVCYYIQGPAEF